LAKANAALRLQGEDLAAVNDTLADVKAELKRATSKNARFSDELEASQAVVRRYDDQIRAMSDDIAQLRETLAQRDLELEALRTELGIVRALSDKFRDTAFTSAHRQLWTVSRPSLRKVVQHWTAFASDRWRAVNAQQAQIDAIRKSGLMDDSWYGETYPDVPAAGLDPVVHYVKNGAWEGRKPHPLFDNDWYRQSYLGLGKLTITPFAHFVTVGAEKGYDPHPLFHCAWYVSQNPEVAALQINPLKHYMDHAAEPGHNPNPLFDSVWYLQENPDVVASGENPLVHYIRRGIAEMRDPHPLFDTEWYLDKYKNVAAAGTDALEHYLTVGALEGCRPGPLSRSDGRRAKRKLQNIGANEERLGDKASAPAQELVRSSESASDIMKWQMSIAKQQTDVPRFTGQIGVFIHLFYEEFAAEIAQHLRRIPFDFKAYVSTNNNEKKEAIEAAFLQFGLEPVIKIVPNRGWDMAPFLVAFAKDIQSHEICLKLHGKGSRHKPRQFGAQWRKYLLTGLLGGPRNVSFIVNSFMANPELGVVMLRHWHGVAGGANAIAANYQAMNGVLRRVGLSIAPKQRIEFPSGSMFWFRSSALAPLLELDWTWPDFNGCRSRELDGTIAHGLERCILIFAAKAGYKWAFLPRRWALKSFAPARGWDSARSVARPKR
jgi:hypothetical protein